ncbi:MAG: hypothetical protein V3U92_15615 [Cellulophaga sp.]
MDTLQDILVYIIVLAAFGYLAKKYILPKKLFPSKKKKENSCGTDDCGCH